MRRRGRHQHDVLARHDAAVTVDDGDAEQRPARFRLCDVALDLGFRHAGIMLERERGDRLARLVAAANAGESDQRADIGAPARKLFRFGGGVERLALQAHGGKTVMAANVAAPARARLTPRHRREKGDFDRPPLIGVCGFTWVRSMAARITFGFSKAWAYSSPREASHVINSPTVRDAGGNFDVFFGLADALAHPGEITQFHSIFPCA